MTEGDAVDVEGLLVVGAELLVVRASVVVEHP